jgi:Secretion system C-terminal sorting domain
MKKLLLPMLALATTTVSSFAQSKTFAITSEKKGEFSWTAIRELDFSSGEFTKTLYTKAPQQNQMLRSAAGNVVNDQTFINGRGVAAAAFDKNTNRLYFSEMYGNTLKFVDINTSTTGSLVVGESNDARFSTGAKKYDESNVITRMAFTNEGVGYALTNDASSLIKFTTGANATVINLGGLTDSRKNKDISIHSQCTSWGGDMIGDIYGNLYLITMRNNVFKINIAKMEAEYMGAIKNLNTTFTTNGAAADDDGNILLSSATNADCYYKVNASTLEATKINAGKDLYNVSDLANANLVYQRKPSATTVATTTLNTDVSVYPNPAVGKNFNVSFNKLATGTYNLTLTDINGKNVMAKQVNVSGIATEKITMPKATTAGVYMLRVVDANGKTISTNRVVVQ